LAAQVDLSPAPAFFPLVDGGWYPVSDRVDCVDRSRLAERSWVVMLAALAVLVPFCVMGLLLLAFRDRLDVQGGGSGDLSDPFQISPGGCLLVLAVLCGLVLTAIAYQGLHGG